MRRAALLARGAPLCNSARPVASSGTLLLSRCGAGALLLSALLAASPKCFGQDIRWESVGIRFGFYPYGDVEDFHAGDIFANWTLPWGWDLNPVWHLQTRLDGSAGWLGEDGKDAAVFSLGPSFCLSRYNVPLSFEIGASPTALTRTDFPGKDLGFPVQFASHAALNLNLGSHVRLIYRLQHMSNGGLAKPNPGLNLHMFGVSYLF